MSRMKIFSIIIAISEVPFWLTLIASTMAGMLPGAARPDAIAQRPNRRLPI